MNSANRLPRSFYTGIIEEIDPKLKEFYDIRKGRKYFECDIDFDGGYRNEKRILYSSDGLIYYTEDHYNTFEDITERE